MASNGQVPTTIDRENSGAMTLRLLDAAHTSGVGDADPVEANSQESSVSNDDLVELLRAARKAFEGGGGKGGKGGNGPAARHPALFTAIIGVLAALASAAGGYAVLKTTVASNSAAIESHAAKPMHEGDVKYMADVEKHVGTIEERLVGVEKGQAAIVKGIDELKQENINRLKADLEKAEAELRRRRRDDR
jgi:hypothetical protein